MSEVSEKESYRYITLSGEGTMFEESVTSAVIDGFEVVHINSNTVAVPNPLQQRVDIKIVYSAVLRRKEKLKFKIKESGDKNDRGESRK